MAPSREIMLSVERANKPHFHLLLLHDVFRWSKSFHCLQLSSVKATCSADDQRNDIPLTPTAQRAITNTSSPELTVPTGHCRASITKENRFHNHDLPCKLNASMFVEKKPEINGGYGSLNYRVSWRLYITSTSTTNTQQLLIQGGS